MLERRLRYWWVPALRGVLAILFGIFAFVWPVSTLAALVILFGAWALVDGAFAMVDAARSVGEPRWWAPLLEGLTGVVVGLLVFFWPALSAVALLYVIAAWAVITGIFEIIAAFRLREEIEGEWLLGLTGALSILLGFFLMMWPGAGALALVWAIGSYAIFYGALLIGLGLRLRGFGRRLRTRAAA